MGKCNLVVVISQKTFPILEILAGWGNPSSNPFAHSRSRLSFQAGLLTGTSNTISILWYLVEYDQTLGGMSSLAWSTITLND